MTNVDRFRPYRLRPNSDDILFYHVYDSLSETPFVTNIGIISGKGLNCTTPPHAVITYREFANHLNCDNREPTSFISFSRNSKDAYEEAMRRMGQIRVKDPHGGPDLERNPKSVRIAIASASAMDNTKTFYFSTLDLIDMLKITSDSYISPQLRENEWFVLGYIPTDAIVIDVVPEVFHQVLGVVDRRQG
ncbi:uncharacterized protein KY384_004126 [Bacidia gigantensis]|uniref:uncharacterized protein n=1 Tax=Bacidia gigantensis TaxID=2732470 RepID=UPI001D03CF5F|nr:uncharacterized protein KY384_004126 [Bacidia gigantensis]KAG8530769.1 hypothetical protein KY384_004126 [Bacidia gigantensis]